MIVSGTIPTDNFDRTVVSRSSDEGLSMVNPNYTSKEWKWRNNCQRCVPAYEMRRRGYDVTAKPNPANNLAEDVPAAHFELAWEEKNIKWCMRDDGLHQIKEYMQNWGDGARAEVFVCFDDGEQGTRGHVFFAEQIEGKTYFYDPQNFKADASEYFKIAKKGKTKILRIDNNVPSDYILECCENRR